jgi:hypothetical protein
MERGVVMGYYVNITAVDFRITAEKLPGALAALKELNQHNELKSGGGYGPDGTGKYRQTSWHFAWMPEDYDQTMHSVREILEALSFEVEDYGEDGLEITGYDAKSGDEEHFLRALAPFVEPGCYIEWRGEEDDMWRQEFDGQTMTTKTGTIRWE